MITGRHIKVIGAGNPVRLRSVSGIYDLLGALVTSLNMRALGPPVIYEVEENISRINCEPFEDEGGVTGVVILSTSHCAIHTWPLTSKFVLDVFSCRKFDPAIVARLVSEAFETWRLRVSDLSQALTLPDDPEPVRDLDVNLNLASAMNGNAAHRATPGSKSGRGARAKKARGEPRLAPHPAGDS
ncbi:S-adenosylmethionine decarboxylase [Bradyrhizobium sp.]|uniref:S-adenosylmethionine decarboxylase n=1 Tax=Bradyrhizobium sp. TaxID=376 RepID=UPI003C6F8023